jgi:hypothetical protein
VSARVLDGWRFGGIPALILENAALRVTVLPELGGHVMEMVDKAADRNLLWANPRKRPIRAPYGANFDDWWSGGWDEIFPTGDRAQLNGELLPYMGELWSVPWTALHGSSYGSAWIEAVGVGTMVPAQMRRRLELCGDEPVLHATYRLTSLDVRPLPFLWGIHPSFAVTPDHRIDIPTGQMLVGVSSGPEMGEVGATYQWPIQPAKGLPSGLRDARLVLPASAGVFGGHWATQLREGWLALTDTRSHRGVALSFSPEVFGSAWLWQVYGGWRGHHHVCLEPWTGYPMDLERAAAEGRAAVLEPGASIEAEVDVLLYEGLDRVASVERTQTGWRVG